MHTCKSYFSKKEIIFCIVCTSRYYNIQKIRWYQKLELRYDYTTGILLNTSRRFECQISTFVSALIYTMSIHICTYKHIQTYIQTIKHTNKQTNTNKHTNTIQYTYVHTYTYIRYCSKVMSHSLDIFECKSSTNRVRVGYESSACRIRVECVSSRLTYLH